MKDFIRLMKKHGTFTQACVILFFILFSLGVCIDKPTHGNIVSMLALVMMLCWEGVETCLKERIDLTKTALADTKDKLILEEHEVERLKLELEATQSALKEAKKGKHHSSYVQTGLAQTEEVPEARTAIIDTAEANADILPTSKPKPRPKRRPAPKRKPKQTEHENKD